MVGNDKHATGFAGIHRCRNWEIIADKLSAAGWTWEEQKAGLAEMKSVVSKQEAVIAQQKKQIEALTATVRKVSERVELSAPAPQIAANDD